MSSSPIPSILEYINSRDDDESDQMPHRNHPIDPFGPAHKAFPSELFSHEVSSITGCPDWWLELVASTLLEFVFQPQKNDLLLATFKGTEQDNPFEEALKEQCLQLRDRLFVLTQELRDDVQQRREDGDDCGWSWSKNGVEPEAPSRDWWDTLTYAEAEMPLWEMFEDPWWPNILTDLNVAANLVANDVKDSKSSQEKGSPLLAERDL